MSDVFKIVVLSDGLGERGGGRARFSAPFSQQPRGARHMFWSEDEGCQKQDKEDFRNAKSEHCRPSFVAQSLDGRHLRGPPRGIQGGEETDKERRQSDASKDMSFDFYR